MSWQALSMLLVVAALAAGFLWYERSRPSSKLIAVVGVMAAAAVAGRVVLTPIPNVQATTDICLISGFVLGAGPGFAIGAIAALASNFFLGQGPWTPWEMLGWGAAGVLGAALAAAHLRPRAVTLALVCGLAGLAFGAWMDLFTLLNFAAETSGDSYLAISAVSLPFNLAHALGNALFALALGPALVRLLTRFRRRFEVSWDPVDAPAPPRPLAAPTAIGVLTVTLVFVVALASTASTASAASGASGALRYLERAQNGDGGFGGGPGQRSNQLITGWVAIGLEAGGRNPLDTGRKGRTPVDFIRSARSPADIGELERTILALRGAGLRARAYGGRDLVADLLRRQRDDGSWNGQVNWTSFGILALRAGGRAPRTAPVRRATRFLLAEQNTDGGFTFAGRGGTSDVDDTGSALQALAAAGRRGSRAVERARSYLRSQQNPDGGFGQLARSRSNAQSTAWAVQGLVATGVDPGRFGRGRSPLAYLRSLQQDDGSFRYSRTSSQTPVWVTAQALAAVRRKPLPLAPVPRRKAKPSARPAPPAVNEPRRQTQRRKRERKAERQDVQPPSLPPPASLPATSEPVSPAPAAEVGSDDGAGVRWVALGLALTAVTGGGAVLARRRLRRNR